MKELKYFKASEFKCPDGTLSCMRPCLLQKLEEAREIAGVPFVLNSAFRTEEHNKNVGGKKDSAHLYGYAVDIEAVDSRTRCRVLTGLIKAGFNRIGISKTFIHADCDPNKDQEVVWMY